jgi:hypothetical protein
LELHDGRSLIFRGSSRYLILQGVACIDEYLPHAVQSFSSLSRILGNATVPRHEDVGSEIFDLVKDA